MFGAQYYNQSIRKYIIAFGNLFNDIVVRRINNAGEVVQSLRVPIAYGPKQKFLVRISSREDRDMAVYISTPRIGFDMESIEYDATRKLQSTIKNATMSGTDNTVLKTQFVPVPYNINLRLSILVQNADDGAQIIEQILPYFTPDWTITMNLIPEMKIKMDVPVVLTGVSLEDTYEGDYDTRRALVWDLNFTMKGYLFGPTNHQGVITRTQVDFMSDTAVGKGRDERVVITPGQHANGTATTNSAASIARSQISANSDYGFATDMFSYIGDGKVYRPKSGQDS
jgi:hypothetical protein